MSNIYYKFNHLSLSDKLLSGKDDDDGEVEHQELTEVIDLLEQDDPSLSVLNLNNHPLITSQHILEIITALENNTHVTELSLTNVKFDDNHAAVSNITVFKLLFANQIFSAWLKFWTQISY